MSQLSEYEEIRVRALELAVDFVDEDAWCVGELLRVAQKIEDFITGFDKKPN